MASQSAGIQQLLAAEKKAAEKVAEARKRKFVILNSTPENYFVIVFLVTCYVYSTVLLVCTWYL